MKFSESLKKNKDFQVVYKNGKSYANRYLVLYIRENGMDKNRLGQASVLLDVFGEAAR